MTPRNHRAEPSLYRTIHGFLNTGEATLSDFTENIQHDQHEVVLQALERDIIYEVDSKPVKIFYGVENFAGTERSWDKTAVVFVETGEHPDLTEFLKQPETALKKVNGRYAGKLNDSRVINGPGQPRLRSLITFSDPEVKKLYEAGQLAVSTALHAHAAKGRLQGKVIPNHVLLFKPGKTQPRDLGSMFLNTDFSESIDSGGGTLEKLDKLLSDFSNGLKNLMNTSGPEEGEEDDKGGEMEPDINEKLKLANSALEIKEQEVKGLKDKINALEADMKNTQDSLDKFRQAESDRTWAALKNTTIPPGFLETETKEKELRELYNTDRDAFYQKIIGVQKKAPGTGKEGQQFTNSEADKKRQEISELWDNITGEAIRLGPSQKGV